MTLFLAFSLAPATFGAGGVFLAQAAEGTGSQGLIPGSGANDAAELPLNETEIAHIRDQAIAAVERLKAEQGAPSFIDLIPPQYRNWVIWQADRAHPTKGAGRSVGEFRDLMAQEWLAHREVFGLLAGAAGFIGLPEEIVVSSWAPQALLALTISGSLIGMTRPLKLLSREKERRYFYSRIGIRCDVPLSGEGTGRLSKEGVRIGRPLLILEEFRSSRVIAAARHTSAGPEVVSRTVVSMAEVSNSLGEVIWRSREERK